MYMYKEVVGLCDVTSASHLSIPQGDDARSSEKVKK